MNRIPPAEYQRARTNLYEIAKDLVPAGTSWREEGRHMRAEHSGGLSINLVKAAWTLWGAGLRGYSPVRMIAALRPGYSIAECVIFLTAWLAQHLGTGSCGLDDYGTDEDDAVAADTSRERALQIEARMQPVPSTGAEAHLNARGIFGPFPPGIFYLEDARFNGGECALVARLEWRGRTTGYQVGYLTPDGKKSLVLPQRERFNLEKANGAVFRFPANPEALAGPRDPVADYLTTEGVEGALALHKLGRPAMVIGLPGVWVIPHLEFPRQSRVVHFEDGDPEGSPAALACDRGIDHLVNAGLTVWRVPTPIGLDSDDILNDLGIEALGAMLERRNLRAAALSYHGRVANLAKRNQAQDPAGFAQERAAIHKIFKTSVGQIDADLQKLRPPPPPKPGDPDDPAAPEDAGPPLDEPWTEPVVLASVLDSVVAELPHYLVAPSWQYDVISLWGASSHLVHNEAVALQIMPQLAFQSLTPNAGKSTGLESAATISCRGYLRGSYTAATVFRKITADRCSLFLVDLHNTLGPQNTDLKQIVDACHRKAEALVDRTEGPDAKGRRFVVTYLCWAALGWTSIGPMIQEVQGRAIVLPTRSALPAEYRKLRTTTSPASSAVLIAARRQLAAWAATLDKPLDPKLPDALFNRLASNWRPLYAIAQMAGGEWPDRVQAAMEEAEKVEKTVPLKIRLLADIRKVFQEGAWPDSRISSTTLGDKLCDDAEAGWAEANHGKRITVHWLGNALRGFLDPPGSQEWQEGRAPNRTHVRGYELHQFQDAFLRYLPPTPVPTRGTSGTTGVGEEKVAEMAEISCPSAPSTPGTDLGQEKSGKSKEMHVGTPVVPVVPLNQRGVGERIEEGAPGAEGSALPADKIPESAASLVRQHLEKPGSYVLITMIEGHPHYTFDDGKALSAAEFHQLDLVPVTGEALFADGSPQRYVLRRPITTATPATTVPTLAEQLAEKLGSALSTPNGPADAPAPPGKPGSRRSMRSDTIRDAVLAYAHDHPEWDAKAISKMVPRAVSVIQRILDAAREDAPPEGTV
jgi:hypothetical protein